MPRLSISFQQEIWEYVEMKAKSLGISKAGVVMVAVGKMREQDQVLEFLSKMPADKLKEAIEKMGDDAAL